ncbi:hypothetical protein LJK87_19360 [Paenibacillus sp. P25]|nr:hypothetical protein LJK87_19360 [Paenibacillus sp. P25]
MYLAFVLAELAGLLLLIMISWIAGSKASRLVYSPSGAMLYRKAGKRLFWAGFLAVTAAAVMTVMALMIRSFDPVIWQDRAYLHGPLIAVPVLSVLLLSIPKLLRLRKETKPEPEDQPPAAAHAGACRGSRPGRSVPGVGAGGPHGFLLRLDASRPVPVDRRHTVCFSSCLRSSDCGEAQRPEGRGRPARSGCPLPPVEGAAVQLEYNDAGGPHGRRMVFVGHANEPAARTRGHGIRDTGLWRRRRRCSRGGPSSGGQPCEYGGIRRTGGFRYGADLFPHRHARPEIYADGRETNRPSQLGQNRRRLDV